MKSANTSGLQDSAVFNPPRSSAPDTVLEYTQRHQSFQLTDRSGSIKTLAKDAGFRRSHVVEKLSLKQLEKNKSAMRLTQVNPKSKAKMMTSSSSFYKASSGTRRD